MPIINFFTRKPGDPTKQELHDAALEIRARRKLQDMEREWQERRIREAAEADKRMLESQKREQESCSGCIFLMRTNEMGCNEVIIHWDCVKYSRRIAHDSGALPVCAKPLQECTGKVLT